MMRGRRYRGIGRKPFPPSHWFGAGGWVLGSFLSQISLIFLKPPPLGNDFTDKTKTVTIHLPAKPRNFPLPLLRHFLKPDRHIHSH